MSKPNYSKAVDAVVYGATTRDLTSDDWMRLAMAALDQAGMNGATQKRIAALIGLTVDGGGK